MTCTFINQKFQSNYFFLFYEFPLHIALNYGNIDMFKLLLSWPKIDINEHI